ncbi:hypothetical protein [Alicyclobacillus macrosporangiidus]|uniref:Lipoprotein n=1 Tax=Alicyclobacillus macrosporangiidus TaxID=392015 RepID=A0A1I7IAD6_9BACL|nr:hypothetical protein [Alicyclobacillus macrosporangiidus]SFU69935.1 hypothetical protein SAMN05421543_10699 [Alicyclobacillus macrosporangiidus]
MKLRLVYMSLAALMMVAGCGGSQHLSNSTSSTISNQASPSTSQSNSTAPTSTQSNAEVTQTIPPSHQNTWNVNDIDVATNGNIDIAISKLKDVSASDVKKQAQAAKPGDVMKAPWKYYGKIVKLSGQVGIAQEYAPGSDISQAFGGGEVGELVIGTEDMTFIDYMNIGSTGDVNVGDMVTVYGYPVGQVQADNKLGGKTAELAIIGKLVEKQQGQQ